MNNFFKNADEDQPVPIVERTSNYISRSNWGGTYIFFR